MKPVIREANVASENPPDELSTIASRLALKPRYARNTANEDANMYITNKCVFVDGAKSKK
jgi:hypothetical protein